MRGYCHCEGRRLEAISSHGDRLRSLVSNVILLYAGEGTMDGGETPLWVGFGAVVLSSGGMSAITHHRMFMFLTRKAGRSAGLIS